MNQNKETIKYSILFSLILLAAFSRFLPHPPNFTPIGGMALFGAAYFGRKYLAFVLPFIALWISNLVIDNVLMAVYYDGFQWFSNPFVYLSFGLIVLMGMGLLKKVTFGRVLGSGILASMVFFLVSNFGSWLEIAAYPKTVEGLLACYAAAIPFFWNTLAGNLIYAGLLFGAWEALRRMVPTLRTA